MVGPEGLQQHLRRLGFVATLEPLAEIEFHVAVHSPVALVIPGLARLAQQDEQLPKAEAGVLSHQLGQSFDDRAIVRPLGLVVNVP